MVCESVWNGWHLRLEVERYGLWRQRGSTLDFKKDASIESLDSETQCSALVGLLYLHLNGSWVRLQDFEIVMVMKYKERNSISTSLLSSLFLPL
jgi:hypothetical protein